MELGKDDLGAGALHCSASSLFPPLPYFQFSTCLSELERTPAIQSVRLWKGRKQSKYYSVTVYGKSRILALPDISPSLSQGIGQGREIGQLGGGRDGVPCFLFCTGLWLL